MIFTRPDRQTLERAHPGGREILSRYASFLAVPATAGGSFDQGILALRSVLPGGHGPLDAACDRLISSLAGRFEDDVTVILARIPAIPA